MKKRLITMIMCALCFSLVSCNKGTNIEQLDSENNSIEILEEENKEKNIDKKEFKKHNPKKIKMTVEPYDILTGYNTYTKRDVKNIYSDYQKVIKKIEQLYKKYSQSPEYIIDDDPFESSGSKYYTYSIRPDYNNNGKADKDECNNKLENTYIAFPISLEETVDSIEGDTELDFTMRYILDKENPISIADTNFSDFLEEIIDVKVDFSEIDAELSRLRSLPDDEKPDELKGIGNRALSLSDYWTDAFRISVYATEDSLYIACWIPYVDNSDN